jgi:hypothetical protein
MTIGIFSRCLLRSQGARREQGHDDVDLEPDQFCCELGQAAELSFRRSELQNVILPLDMTELAQTFAKLLAERWHVGVADDECADPFHLRLLRPRDRRPSRGRASKHRNEMAPSHKVSLSCGGVLLGAHYYIGRTPARVPKRRAKTASIENAKASTAARGPAACGRP